MQNERNAKSVVSKLDEAAKVIRVGEEELLSIQVSEFADLVNSLISETEPATASMVELPISASVSLGNPRSNYEIRSDSFSLSVMADFALRCGWLETPHCTF